MYEYMYVCMYVKVRTYAFMHACMHGCMYVCMYAGINIYAESDIGMCPTLIIVVNFSPFHILKSDV